MTRCSFAIGIVALLISSISIQADETVDAIVSVPAAWKAAPAVDQNGYGWYFCVVEVPNAWADHSWLLHVEAVDDAREFFCDGHRIGSLGTMPPKFRSGLGESKRIEISRDNRGGGARHTLAVRVYYRDGRTGFNAAAPVLVNFVPEESARTAIRLEGNWAFRPGDDAAWLKATMFPGDLVPKRNVESALDVERTFRKINAGDLPLDPRQSLQKMHVPNDLSLQLVLSEPEIAQPLSMKWDARGRLWLVEYRQYPNPAGLTAISRDKFLRTVYDQVPKPPPHHVRGADRISIHEDRDGDGVYEQHKTFVDGLSLATSVAIESGGVWVLNPPYLLFYPDADGNDVPDGDPVVHLEGFGIEDSHSLANNLRWGPDGWLYGAQGSTVTGNVRRPGEKASIQSLGQLIWRYHPTLHKYEVFAEGGGNTFGLEIDLAGRIFSGHNGADTRGFHYVQGGYSQKGFGKHGALSNPYTFGYFPAMKTDPIPRFTHCFVINDDTALGENYRGRMFSVAPLQGQVIVSAVKPDGSTFQTHDEGMAITSDDTWFRPVDIQQSPDGSIYVADMYEQRIDHASHYQGRIDTKSGRIYRLAARQQHRPAAPLALTKQTSAELLLLLSSGNRWQRQTAQRLLINRDLNAVDIIERCRAATGQNALELLWLAHARGLLNEISLLSLLQHSTPQVRRWAVQVACNSGDISPPIAGCLTSLAENESSIEVRSQLASSARRLPLAQSLSIVANLLKHDEDLHDPQLPLLIWWAIETHCQQHRGEVLTLFSDKSLWDRHLVRDFVSERLMKRYAMAATRQDFATCAQLMAMVTNEAETKRLVQALAAAIEHRPLTAAPPELLAALEKHGGGSLILRLRRGDQAAVAEALQSIADVNSDNTQAAGLIAALPLKDHPQVADGLLAVATTSTSDERRAAAIAALAAADSTQVPTALLKLHQTVPAELRLAIQNTLASREAWAGELVASIEHGTILADQISPVLQRKMRLFANAALQVRVDKLWPSDTASSAEIANEMVHFQQLILAAEGNPYAGHKLFAQQCAKCHKLFGEGGSVGPDLTGHKRDDVRSLLVNLLQPSLEIREGFETYVVNLNDGRVVSGLLADQDPAVVVIRGIDGNTTVIARNDIEELRATPLSLMPEGLLKDLSAEQLRNLFAYLRSTQPLPE